LSLYLARAVEQVSGLRAQIESFGQRLKFCAFELELSGGHFNHWTTPKSGASSAPSKFW
jgi:hypothetical protein